MKTLVLGGTQFLGRHIVQALLRREHDVTLFNRGQTNPQLFADQVTTITGDRDGGLDLLKGEHFDACIDPSGYVPRLVAASCELLVDVVAHYTFISSISAYPKFVPGQDESAPTATLDDPTTEDASGPHYGGLKVLCEAAAEKALPGRVLNVRAGLLVGPFDPTDRFTYWPVRYREGGNFVAPVGPDLPVQFIDARDIAEWVVHCTERQVTGTFNVTGPQRQFKEVLGACATVVGGAAQPVWLPEDVLLEQGVAPWVDLPMWLTQRARSMMQLSTAQAEQHGLTTRSVTETIRDIVGTHHLNRDELVAGLKRQRELELLQAA